jgi:CubicO group peptidase (beta-lactamase class C family)
LSVARALEAIHEWGADHAGIGVTNPSATIAVEGEVERPFRIASVTKPLVAMAVLVAVEEETLGLDDDAGPPGSTVRHLLAHASGLPFEGAAPIAGVGVRRIYSNTGFEVLAGHLEQRTGMSMADYLREAVLAPLDMRATELAGSPAKDVVSTVVDLLRFGRELLSPTLISAETLAEATTTVFPGLNGVLPGVGPQRPMDWGLGFEVKDKKERHWTARIGNPRTFGHFGGAGTFLWVDPDAQLSTSCLTDREFGPWALDAWPRVSDAILLAR